MDVDPDSIYRRGSTILCRQHTCCCDVHTHGCRADRNGIFHRMALSSLGDQTVLESVCRHFRHTAQLGNSNAVLYRHQHGTCGFVPSAAVFLCIDSFRFLADGLFLSHARYRRRRLLHARTDSQRPGCLCGSAQHILPHSVTDRTRGYAVARRRDGGTHRREYTLCLVCNIRLAVGRVSCHIGLSHSNDATPAQRPRDTPRRNQ